CVAWGAHRDGVDLPPTGGQRGQHRVEGGGDVVDREPEGTGDVVARPDGDDAQRHAGAGDRVRAEVDHAVPADDDDGVQPLGETGPRPGQAVGEVPAGEVEHLPP